MVKDQTEFLFYDCGVLIPFVFDSVRAGGFVYLRRMYLSFVVTHHVPTKQSSGRKVNNYGTTTSSTILG
jgi:hypothetical protein